MKETDFYTGLVSDLLSKHKALPIERHNDIRNAEMFVADLVKAAVQTAEDKDTRLVTCNLSYELEQCISDAELATMPLALRAALHAALRAKAVEPLTVQVAVTQSEPRAPGPLPAKAGTRRIAFAFDGYLIADRPTQSS